MELLVTDGRSVVAQQPQRDLLLDRGATDLFAEQRQLILQIGVVGRRRELEVDCVAVIARDKQEMPPRWRACRRRPAASG